MTAQPFYEPAYRDSHALIIGIDKYQRASPLSFAANDARGISSILEKKFLFPPENIALLTDGGASRSAIMSAYMRFTNRDLVGTDDRLIVFFAGHGHTAFGQRRETGFLVPVDGDVTNLASLIRWEELTRCADLIPAKHVLFLMDACYGGLAITRKTLPPGSMRLLKDMLQRFSRQVLTAGKADETVLDGGGARAGHSIFTSHVLDALEGAASATEGVITANGVMSYVYDKVGNDPLSQQTPHYGFLEGDGDFIFAPLVEPSANTAKDEPVLIQTPSFGPPTVPPAEETFSERLKQLIADPAEKIRLDDFVSAHLRRTVQALGLDKFPVQGRFPSEEFAERIKAYEQVIADLEVAVILLSRWARPEQVPVLEKIFARLAEADKGQQGGVHWINLGWYPILILMYAGGITALAEQRYDMLRVCLLTPVAGDRLSSRKIEPVILPTITALTAIVDAFKMLPGLEQRYTPRSDHLFQALQPIVEDQLFLGRSYEMLFDQFEVLLALTFADVKAGDPIGQVWGPPGRFAWQHERYGDQAPFARVVAEAQRQNNNWGPLKAGMFGSSIERFMALSAEYGHLLNKIGWW
jgi:Caspase domain